MFSKKSSKEYSYLLLGVVPILDLYMTPIPIVSLGEIVLVISTIIICCTESNNNLINAKSWIISFFTYGIIISPLMYLFRNSYFSDSAFKELLNFIIYVTLFFLLAAKLNVQTFLKYYTYIAIIASVFLILQYIIHFSLGIWPPGVIPGVESSVGFNTIKIINRMTRPTSFFAEPAHFAQFISIPFLYGLFYKCENKIVITLFTLSLALNQSGNALVVLCVALVGYTIKLIKQKGILYIIPFIAFVFLGLFYLFNANQSFQDLLYRVNELSGNGGDGSYSGYIRIVRGYTGFFNMDLYAKIFGIGIGMYEQYFRTDLYRILSIKTGLIIEYVNGIQYYLLSVGFVGVFLFFTALWNAVKNGFFYKKIIAISLISFMFISAIYSEWKWLYFLLVIFITTNETEASFLTFKSKTKCNKFGEISTISKNQGDT